MFFLKLRVFLKQRSHIYLKRFPGSSRYHSFSAIIRTSILFVQYKKLNFAQFFFNFWCSFSGSEPLPTIVLYQAKHANHNSIKKKKQRSPVSPLSYKHRLHCCYGNLFPFTKWSKDIFHISTCKMVTTCSLTNWPLSIVYYSAIAVSNHQKMLKMLEFVVRYLTSLLNLILFYFYFHFLGVSVDAHQQQSFEIKYQHKEMFDHFTVIVHMQDIFKSLSHIITCS